MQSGDSNLKFHQQLDKTIYEMKQSTLLRKVFHFLQNAILQNLFDVKFNVPRHRHQVDNVIKVENHKYCGDSLFRTCSLLGLNKTFEEN